MRSRLGLSLLISVALLSCEGKSAGKSSKGASEGKVLVSGTVVLSETLQVRPSRFGALFVSLVLEAGPPLAVKTYMNPRFPFAFRVTEADLLMQETEPRGPFRVRVRFDQDGNVETTAPGDWIGETEELVNIGATGVRVVLTPVQ